MPPLLVPTYGGHHMNCFCRATIIIKDPQNQKVLSKLIKEVKFLNQSFDIVDIRGKQKSNLFKLACVMLLVAIIIVDQRRNRDSAEGLLSNKEWLKGNMNGSCGYVHV